MKWSNRVGCVIGLLAVLDGYSAAAYLPASYNKYNNHGDISQFLLHVPNITNDIATPRWVPHMDLGGAYFNDDPHGRGEVNFFVPFNSSGYQLFYGDARGYKNSSEGFEGNFAMGYRRLFRTGLERGTDYAYTNNWQAPWNMFGVYFSYDILRSETENWFNQVSGGFEYWHQRFFVGANGYVPIINTTQDDEDANVAIATRPAGSDVPSSGVYGNILYSEGHERALPGVDAEVGYNVWRGLNVFGGAYYYHRSPAPTVWGPKASAEYTFYPHPWHHILGMFNRITFDTEVKHDKPRGTTWYAGMRVTIDLSSRSHHGLEGVARHMVDPIRRDVDIITVSYHDDPLNFLQMNGRNANVKYVSTSTGALDAANDPNVDIIAVNGSVTGVPRLTLAGNGDMVMTGGAFNFSAGGTNFVISNLGNDGSLTAASNSQLIEIGPGGNDLTLQDLTLNTNSDGSGATGANIAISNFNGTDYSNTFGNLTLKNITSNGALDIRSPSGAATVNVSDSTFYVAFDNGAPSADAVRFEADGGTLTISSFSNVQVTASGTPTSAPLYGIYNYAKGGNVIYPNAFATTVTVTGGGSQGISGIRNEAAANSSLTFNSTFSSNNVTVTGATSGASAIGIDNVSAGTLTFAGAVNLNTVNASGQGITYALSNSASGSGTVTYGSTFDGNTLTAANTTTNNEAAGLYNNAAGTSAITFNSSVTGNTISASSSAGQSNAVHNVANAGNISYNGVFSLNGISSTGQSTNPTRGVYNNAASGGSVNYVSTFTGNTIGATNTTTTGAVYAIENYSQSSSSSLIQYNGSFFDNNISATGIGNGTSNIIVGMYSQAQGGSLIQFVSSYTGNLFAITTQSGGTGEASAVQNFANASGSRIIFGGDFTSNTMNVTANGSGIANGLYNLAEDTNATITFNSFVSNPITVTSTSSTISYGVRNIAKLASSANINFGAFSNNVITAFSGGSTYGVSNEVESTGGLINFNSVFSGNTISATATTTTGNQVSRGVSNTLAGAGGITFSGNVSNNTISATMDAGTSGTRAAIGFYNGNTSTTANSNITFSGLFGGSVAGLGNSISATGPSTTYAMFNQTGAEKINFGTTSLGFNYNTFSSISSGGASTGMYNNVTGAGQINVEGSFTGNSITAGNVATGTTVAYGIHNYTSGSGSINFDGLFGGTSSSTGNTLTVKGTSTVYGMYNQADAGNIAFGGAFSYNTITASATASGTSNSYGIWNSVSTGTVAIAGNFNNNDIESSTTLGTAYGIWNDITATNSNTNSINFAGSFSANTIKATSSNTSAFGLYNSIASAATSGKINFAGIFGGVTSATGNTITVSGSGAGTSYGIYNSLYNGTIEFGSSILNNTISVTSSNGIAYGFANVVHQDNSTDYSGDIILTSSSSDAFSNNIITATASNGTSVAQGFRAVIEESSASTDPSITINGSFNGNTLTGSGGSSSTTSSAFYATTNATGGTITIGTSGTTTFANNNFNSSSYGLYLLASGTNTAAGSITLNTSTDGMTGNTVTLSTSSSNGGFYILGKSGSTGSNATIKIPGTSSTALTSNNTLVGGDGSETLIDGASNYYCTSDNC